MPLCDFVTDFVLGIGYAKRNLYRCSRELEMAFAKFMAGSIGRGVRILAGIVLMAIGLFVMKDTAGIVVAVIGVVPILAGVLNVCLISPLIGAPFSGKAALNQ